MSTHFSGEGNIGSPPEYREFPNGNDEPRRLLRLNVYFDNPIPTKGGDFEDRGGFWAPVEIWHRDAAHWKDLYQKGMRVLVVGRITPFGQGPGDLMSVAVLGIVTAVAAPLGDLCESMIKRDLGIKDMGSILPGHGGLLDRFDALLFVLPATYYTARMLDLFGA